MSEYKLYTKKSQVEMRPYVPGEVLGDEISISPEDRATGSPKEGDMVARNPANHSDQWLVAKAHFEANYAEPGDRPDLEALLIENFEADAASLAARRRLDYADRNCNLSAIISARVDYHAAHARSYASDVAIAAAVESLIAEREAAKG